MGMNDDQGKLQAAIALHQKGDFAGAGKLYRRLIRRDPNNFQVLHLLGLVEAAAGKIAQAKPLLERALSMQPPNIQVYENYAKVLSRSADHASALNVCQRGLQVDGTNASLLYISGVSLIWLGQPAASLVQLDRLVSCHPNHVAGLHERGSVLAAMGRYEAAIGSFDKALAIEPQLVQAHLNKGTVYALAHRHHEALGAYDAALSFRPDLADALLGRGNVLAELRRYSEAAAAYDRALAIQPGLANVWLGRGNVFFKLQCYDDALAAYQKALALQSDLANAWLGRGNVFEVLTRGDDALAAYDEALALQPGLAEAWLGRGNVLYSFKRYEEAIDAYDRALAINPELPDLIGMRLYTKLHICDWNEFDRECEQLVLAVRCGRPATSPFCLLALPSSPDDQLNCAKAWAARTFPVDHERARQRQQYDHGRIHVAYLSADFRQHAVSVLTAGMFEHHDRTRFRITGISVGPDDQSEMRRRLEAAFDDFVDARAHGDEQLAKLVEALEVDILVDLIGYTRGARTAALARRCAPIQVNYLGYSGTIGTDYVDYIIGDRIVTPDDRRQFYSEKVVCMPGSFLVNDDRRPISDRIFSRAELGLPSSGFVFCCFNSNYKIAPGTFDLWTRVLKRVDGSVLWLSEDNAASVANLRKQAEAKGVDSARLVFAKRVPDIAEHLARHRCADLFLDSLPYNAHTTASDALWSGLPVLTCLGETFAGRVAASLLTAIGLPEFVATGPEMYEQLAVDLATHPTKLDHIRRKLNDNRLTTALFNTKLFTQHIEAAYTAMYERCRAGLPPDHILVPDSARNGHYPGSGTVETTHRA